jgi:hypothetical protein
MITEPIRHLIENITFIFIATADATGQPHIAVGEHVAVLGDSMLVFENWFCPSTLQNIACNTHVSVVAVSPDSGKGYQMIGTVIRSSDAAFLDGFPSIDTPAMPQVLTRFTVKIEQVLEFTSGIHSDLPMVG